MCLDAKAGFRCCRAGLTGCRPLVVSGLRASAVGSNLITHPKRPEDGIGSIALWGSADSSVSLLFNYKKPEMAHPK